MSNPKSGNPLYQAQGYVKGVFERSDEGNYLFLTDGLRLRIDTILFRLKPQLENWLPDAAPCLWSVYPRTKRDGTLSSLMLRSLPVVDCPLSFTVSGQVIYDRDNLITVSIHRNRQPPTGQEHFRTWKPSLITLTGTLPALRCWEYWRIQCELKDGKLAVVAGDKITDAPARAHRAKPVRPPSDSASAADLPPLVDAPPVADPPPPPRQKRVFDLSRL